MDLMRVRATGAHPLLRAGQPVEREKIPGHARGDEPGSRERWNADFVKGSSCTATSSTRRWSRQLKTPRAAGHGSRPRAHLLLSDLNYVAWAQQRPEGTGGSRCAQPEPRWSHAYSTKWSGPRPQAIYLRPRDPLLHRRHRRGWRSTRPSSPAVDEGLGVLHAFNTEVAKTALGVPDTWLPLLPAPRRYPAEDPLTGGQTAAAPACRASSSSDGPISPGGDPEVAERLKKEGLIQEPVDAERRRKAKFASWRTLRLAQ